MLFTPFPRPRYKTYVIIGIVIGACIAFMLNVFQPFGTSTFRHPLKHLILSGYGLVSMCAVAVYYFFSLKVITPKIEDKWNILYESIDFFGGLLFSMTACYVYFNWIFDSSFRLDGYIGFLTNAVALSLLPTIGVLVFLYLSLIHI